MGNFCANINKEKQPCFYLDGKNFNHQEFIILSTARTGSVFLQTLLESHSNIKIFGELFNLGYLARRVAIEALKDPLKYVKNKIYKSYPPQIKAVGFRIFYYQATRASLRSLNPQKNTGNDLKKRIQNFYQYIFYQCIKNIFGFDNLGRKLEKVWTQLKQDSELKIIHLKRRNMLKTSLSLKRAFLTMEWARVTEKSHYEQAAIHLDYDWCLDQFQKTRSWEQKYDSFFQNNKKIEVVYEDLCKDTDAVIKTVLSFLGLQYEALKSPLIKQNNRLLSETISNYWELKERFKNTPWIGFFED